jgi:hypothetical protein
MMASNAKDCSAFFGIMPYEDVFVTLFNDLDDFSPIRRRFTGEDNVIGIDDGLRNDAGLRKRVSAGGGVHDDIVDITKEIINRQQ